MRKIWKNNISSVALLQELEMTTALKTAMESIKKDGGNEKPKNPMMFEDLGRPCRLLQFILPKLLLNLTIHLWTPFWTGRSCSKMRVTARQEFWLGHYDFAIRFIKWSQQDDCAQKIWEILFGIGVRYLIRIFVGIECPSFWSLSKSGSR